MAIFRNPCACLSADRPACACPHQPAPRTRQAQTGQAKILILKKYVGVFLRLKSSPSLIRLKMKNTADIFCISLKILCELAELTEISYNNEGLAEIS